MAVTHVLSMQKILHSTMDSINNAILQMDRNISKSTFGRVFRFEGSGHVRLFPTNLQTLTYTPQPKERKGARFLREIRAGLTTFFTMAYIIAVNVCNDPHFDLCNLTS